MNKTMLTTQDIAKARQRVSSDRISSLGANEIFVFGSNLAGLHGGGAARIAHERFGAVWGNGEGLQGQSYAIPTMHGGVDAIRPYVDNFIDFARVHLEYKFLVTRIGCGIAGFRDEEMAPLFQGCLSLENVYLPQSFLDVLLPDKKDSQSISDWDTRDWLARFEKAKQMRATQSERKEVFHNTMKIANTGTYVSETGKVIQLSLNKDALKENVFCENPIRLQNPERRWSNRVSVHNQDCLDLAHDLLLKDSTDDVCVLNMASAGNPGGGVLNGAGAQEEYLFRCSDYFRFLYQYACHFDCRQYGIEPNKRHSYPFRNDSTGIFSHGVTIFRMNEAKGYALIDAPWKVNFVAVAAHRLPYRTDKIPSDLVPSTLERIRAIFRIAYNNGQRRLVLGALGCGAFNNPPRHMAQLFKKVIEEPEFQGLFREICFAVIEDHNSMNANYKAFRDVLASQDDRAVITELLRQTGRKGIEGILKTMEDRRFFSVPASIRYQNPEAGGLARHSLMVCQEALALWEASPRKSEIRRESVILTALLHDLCKTDVYHEDASSRTGFDKHRPSFPVGHGERSIMLALMSGLEMTEEECVAIRWHMGCHEIIKIDSKGRDTEEYLNYKLGTDPGRFPLTGILQQADGIATDKALGKA